MITLTDVYLAYIYFFVYTFTILYKMGTVQQETTEIRRVRRASKTGSLVISIPHKFIDRTSL